MPQKHAKKGFTSTFERIRDGEAVPEEFLEVFFNVALAVVRKYLPRGARRESPSTDLAWSVLGSGLTVFLNHDDPYDGTLGFFRLLYAIARNKAVSAGRKARRDKQRLADLEIHLGQQETSAERATRLEAYRTLSDRAMQLASQIQDEHRRRLVLLRLGGQTTWEGIHKELYGGDENKDTRGVRTLENYFRKEIAKIRKQLIKEFPDEARDFFGEEGDASGVS